jgi:hypothetical protein
MYKTFKKYVYTLGNLKLDLFSSDLEIMFYLSKIQSNIVLRDSVTRFSTRGFFFFINQPPYLTFILTFDIDT